ncbi:hypothetical protein [Campylobacter curvus]|uniref:hypothetical protein n=1 Tax=Campylobacter curvus TaxID=200 RepID=UPI00036DF521|nr:hypothetical protein [Campylobacter curvus]QKF60474.1 NADH:quinone oxidoreductase I, chain G-like protein (cl35703 superfamily) [Campylobacter curvus]UEB50617.1 hypothetical protein LK426_03995 [Campylobacter curvus]
MKFSKFTKAKSLSLANLLSLTDRALANELKECDFRYISCIEDGALGSENLIRCEIGSISYVLALLCKYTLNLDDGYFGSLDEGFLSGECNVGEEEFEELGEWLKDARNIIIDSSFFTHPDSKMLFEFLEILGKNVILAGGKEQEYETNGNLSELKELENFDGSVIYLDRKDSDEVVGGVQFSIVAKVKDGDEVTLSAPNFNAKRKFRLDSGMKGTIAIVGMSEFEGYDFKLVKVSKS